ncbi:MAG TPA: hypothetical protein VFI27_00445 [candidate division Zixibacteria bacterium]|nr:hypothetical protein [candidate division Zixibacteria bacterium]
MMKRLLIFAIPILLIVMLVPAGVAHAAPNFDRTIREGETVHDDVVIFGETLVIQKGARVLGDVVAFGSDVTLAGDVSGDVAIFGGSANMSGTVDGDLVILGSNLVASSAAEVNGECVLVGGNLRSEGQSGLNCSAFGDISSITVPAISDIPIIPPLPRFQTSAEASYGFFGRMGDIAGRSLLFGLLALALAAVAPKQLSQVTDTIKQKPGASGAVGFLTIFAAISLLVIVAILTAILIFICIGVIGIPIIIGIGVLLAGGLFMGWVSAGVVFGRWLGKVLKLTDHRLTVTAALGTALLTLGAGFLSSLPFQLGGWLWTFVVLAITCAGLGAVTLTRFGTRNYPLSAEAYRDKIEIVMDTLPEDDLPPK